MEDAWKTPQRSRNPGRRLIWKENKLLILFSFNLPGLPGFLARCHVFQASSKRLPTFPCIVATRYAERAYNGFAPSACGARAVRKIVHNVRIKTPRNRKTSRTNCRWTCDIPHARLQTIFNVAWARLATASWNPHCKCKPMGVQTGRGFD